MKTEFYNINKSLILIVAFCLYGAFTQAQDSTAIMDLESTTQGVLIPRMTSAERMAIDGAANSLLVYDTDSESYWFYRIDEWVNLSKPTIIEDADGDTRIVVEQGPDDDIIRFYTNGIERYQLVGDRIQPPSVTDKNVHIGLDAGLNDNGFQNNFIGQVAGDSNSGFQNNFIGLGAGSNNSSNQNNALGVNAAIDNLGPFNNIIGFNAGTNNSGGSNNIIGREAGKNNSGNWNNILSYFSGEQNSGSFNNLMGNFAGRYNTGSYNNFFGHFAGHVNQGWYNNFMGLNAGANNQGGDNIAIGRNALFNHTTGNFNIALGTSSLENNITGTSNIALGSYSLALDTAGINNVVLGYDAMFSDQNTSRNVVIGYRAGRNASGNNNVFLGNNAGFFAAGGNKLYIENSNTNSPLIYGEFDNNFLRINGDFESTGTLTANQAANLNSTLDVTGTTTLNSTLDVTGTATFDNLVQVGGAAGVMIIGNGMKFNYNSGTNELQLFGHNGGVDTGPYMNIRRSDGAITMGPAGGLTYATGYQLSVNGKIAATEVRVDLIGNWPDYVFDEDYDLKPISEVKEHISTNGHLPGVPSAKEVEKTGIEVGKMNTILMEKVEELTLYIIDLEERLAEVEVELNASKK